MGSLKTLIRVAQAVHQWAQSESAKRTASAVLSAASHHTQQIADNPILPRVLTVPAAVAHTLIDGAIRSPDAAAGMAASEAWVIDPPSVGTPPARPHDSGSGSQDECDPSTASVRGESPPASQPVTAPKKAAATRKPKATENAKSPKAAAAKTTKKKAKSVAPKRSTSEPKKSRDKPPVRK